MDLEKLRQELLTLKARIATLEAQIKDPEWVPFPGEIVEFPLFDGGHAIRIATGEVDPSGNPYAYVNGESCGVADTLDGLRPLSDPNVIQLRPHKGGDPMPCKGDERILYSVKNGPIRLLFDAVGLDWSHNLFWAPLPKVSP